MFSVLVNSTRNADAFSASSIKNSLVIESKVVHDFERTWKTGSVTQKRVPLLGSLELYRAAFNISLQLLPDYPISPDLREAAKLELYILNFRRWM